MGDVHRSTCPPLASIQQSSTRDAQEESTEGGVRGSPHVWAFTIKRSRVLRPKSPSLKPRRIRPDCKIKVRNEKGNERRSGFRQALTDYSDFRDVVASDLVNITGPQLLNEALSRAAVERGGRLG